MSPVERKSERRLDKQNAFFAAVSVSHASTLRARLSSAALPPEAIDRSIHRTALVHRASRGLALHDDDEFAHEFTRRRRDLWRERHSRSDLAQ